MSIAIALRKATGRILNYNLQGTVVVEIAVTLKDVNMFHISLTHSLFLGNRNDAMGKDFPLIFLLIYLLIDTYLLPIGVSKPEIQTLLSSQLQQFCLIKGLQYSHSAQTPKFK